MSATARVRLRLGSAAEAERLAASLEPDNGGYLSCHLDGDLLVLEAEADGAMGLLRTLDDALGCIRATGVA